MSDELLPAVEVQPVQAGAPRVSLGGGRWAPRRFWATFDDPARPFVVHAEFFIAADGVPLVYQLVESMRYSAADIDHDGNLVRIDTLKSTDWLQPKRDDLRVPIASILATALNRVSVRGEAAAPGTASQPGQRFADTDDFLADDGYLRPRRDPIERAARRKRTVLTPQLLKEVAAEVRAAEESGRSIRRAVMERFGPMHENTARNWIKAARSEGYLQDVPAQSRPRSQRTRSAP